MEKSTAPQSQNNAAKKTDETSNGQVLGDRLVSESKNPPPPNGGNDANDHTNPSPWWKRLNWTLIIESAVFIVAVYVACIYSRQLDQMIESNKINHEALVSVQRAFLGARSPILDKSVVSEPSGRTAAGWIINISWDNAGTTPAINVRGLLTARKMISEPNEEEFLGDKTLRHNPTFIGPKSSQLSQPVFRPDDFFPVPNTNFVPPDPYIWGWSTYRDIFKDTDFHVTEFCYQLSAFGLSAGKSKYLHSWIQCDHHNCTDQECSDYQAIVSFATAPK